jgi:hypothetical protein
MYICIHIHVLMQVYIYTYTYKQIYTYLPIPEGMAESIFAIGNFNRVDCDGGK